MLLQGNVRLGEKCLWEKVFTNKQLDTSHGSSTTAHTHTLSITHGHTQTHTEQDKHSPAEGSNPMRILIY